MSKSRRKELKHPDEFVSQGQQMLDWIADRQQWVLAIAGGLLLAIVVTYGGKIFLRRQLERNFAKLDAALEVARTEAGPKEVSSLEELSKLDTKAPRFETEEERWDAAAKALAEVEPRLSRKAAKEMAAFYHGEAYVQNEKYEEAIAPYSRYAEETKGDPFLHPLALYNLAVARMNTGKYEDALKDLEAASDGLDPNASIGGSILVAKSLCLARLGKNEEAQAALNTLEVDHSVDADAMGSSVVKAALAMGLPDAYGVSLDLPPKEETKAASKDGKEAENKSVETKAE